MEPKIIKKFLIKENPYLLFSNEKTPLYFNTGINFRENPKQEINSNRKRQTRHLTTYEKPISVISKSLKFVALNSDIYGNYRHFYSNLTQKDTFKTPGVDKYPLLKNKDYLAIESIDSNKEKISFSTNIKNLVFLSSTNEIKVPKRYEGIKPYFFKTSQNKDYSKEENNTISAGKVFGELCDQNLFECKILKQIKIKKIDLNNCLGEKQKNFRVLYDYIQRGDGLKDILNRKNFYKNIEFKTRTAIKKEIMQFILDIDSLCLKFYTLNDSGNNNTEKDSQKLYLPFNLMPLFYLLDFTSFKVLLSEIIIFNQKNKQFEYIKEKSLIKIIRKYYNYILKSFEVNNNYVNNITYNKKETIFSLIYDWIVIDNSSDENEKDNNNSYRCFKLKIILPKIKLNVDNLSIKISKFLNKQIIAILLNNKFKNWERFIFFDLFSTKKFKAIINLIMLNKYYKLPSKKINLNPIYNIHNKDYEFFLTQIGENFSLYYTFIPYVILIVFGLKDKKYQKLNLNLRETINLNKFAHTWGFINSILKCMFLDRAKNKIFFKFDLLEDEEKETNKANKEETKRNNSEDKMKTQNLNKDKLSSSFNLKKTVTKNKSIKDKEMNTYETRYRDKMYEIRLLNCSLRKNYITSNSSKDNNNYYMVPQNILDFIFEIKDEDKLFNNNGMKIPLISKYIGENSREILSAKESSNISEERKMIDKADTIDHESLDNIIPEEEPKKHVSFKQATFDRLPSFNMIQNITTKEAEKEKQKEKKMEEIEEERENRTPTEKRNSNKFVFPKGFFFARSSKKKVSVANANELNQNRFEKLTRDMIKRHTMFSKNLY